ncbi:trafficking protein particle complex subunit 3 [Histomonas meleagridis]|uniref:trafficking protein particle complex subunit 3 n=1 Tax=Histomonas meleagridis TaxID=135588 RepID=UPI00355A3E4E|nr:trafficking protein particle complex subunit 3 [Histomonas meleagridis]KAH0805683.1 trafficking protein particle complex subunit 3 [Histomonas meleagridis]
MATPSIEFSSLIYGSLVNSLLETEENVEEVNKKLYEIGCRIGVRLAHEFARDRSLERIDTPTKVIKEIIVKNWPSVAGKGTNVSYSVLSDSDPKKYLLTFDQSIFTQNVTVPERYAGLRYTSMLPGVICGIFKIFHYEVSAQLKDSQQKPCTEVILEILKEIPIAVPKEDN